MCHSRLCAGSSLSTCRSNRIASSMSSYWPDCFLNCTLSALVSLLIKWHHKDEVQAAAQVPLGTMKLPHQYHPTNMNAWIVWIVSQQGLWVSWINQNVVQVKIQVFLCTTQLHHPSLQIVVNYWIVKLASWQDSWGSLIFCATELPHQDPCVGLNAQIRLNSVPASSVREVYQSGWGPGCSTSKSWSNAIASPRASDHFKISKHVISALVR
jgi:hypothetical protein